MLDNGRSTTIIDCERYPWIFIERFFVLVKVLNTSPSKLIRDNKDDERRRRKSQRFLGMNINDSKAPRI